MYDMNDVIDYVNLIITARNHGEDAVAVAAAEAFQDCLKATGQKELAKKFRKLVESKALVITSPVA